jgi:hypothetical protein
MSVDPVHIPGVPKRTKLVLEEQPKWGLLYDILSEVEHDISVASDHEGSYLLNYVLDKVNFIECN